MGVVVRAPAWSGENIVGNAMPPLFCRRPPFGDSDTIGAHLPPSNSGLSAGSSKVEESSKVAPDVPPPVPEPGVAVRPDGAVGGVVSDENEVAVAVLEYPLRLLTESVA